MKKLALFGGTPVIEGNLELPAWPPVSETTGKKLLEVYMSGQWSFNSRTEQDFEKEFAEFQGAKHGIFMVNGTVTLEAALAVLGIGPGDEVIVPGLTWLATAMAAHYVGATPVFVDVEPDTLCLDPEKFKCAITPRTRAVIPVHLYGSMANLDEIIAIAGNHDIAVVEDCAHMHGGFWNGRGAGASGKIGSFSFQQSKTMASGEGGICITSDDVLADKLYQYKHIGYSRGVRQGEAGDGMVNKFKSHNYRGNAFQALILREQLKDLPNRIETYNRNVDIIKEMIKDVDGVRIQSRGVKADPQGYYGLIFIFDAEPMRGIPLQTIIAAIGAEGLQACESYGPVYKHVLYNAEPDEYRIAEGGCPNAETAGTKHAVFFNHKILGLPKSEIVKIGDIITKVVSNYSELKN